MHRCRLTRHSTMRNRGEVPEASRVVVGGGEKKKVHSSFYNSERRVPNGPDPIHNSAIGTAPAANSSSRGNQQSRWSRAEAISRSNQQRQSAVEGRRQWHQQVYVVVSPPGKIRLALPAEFFKRHKRGAATGVGSGGWGCRGG
ncbi:uncharacterized protein LOC119340948 isoform X3 [Triticum dicoccoides]|uniref:uncharacterized protein LOC119340948 isoform X3 n=1 Tax=Triticum dicoccoides TaxID=85692 RepID=UPI0018913AB2|nr:uncharacterized protein LOC119340948 isoform X3 [Triticum dicoccoides]